MTVNPRDLLEEFDKEEHIKQVEKFDIGPLEEPNSRWAKGAVREQGGKELHGKLVIAAIKLLVNQQKLYPTYKECYEEVKIEGRLAGLHPDVLDEENRIVIECGFNKHWSDSTYDFLRKCIDYLDTLRHYDAIDSWTFIHIPKSVKEGDSALSVIFSKELDDLMEKKETELLESIRSSMEDVTWEEDEE
ncbi:hypothetical protein [Candidatus Nanohalovita haloferacivicina]|uniref:hypothetical protein n=1 Tax=Candidatus Nanohalovita haloferacivicina TaxID=2978046 RepID=UPI00325FD396|nr:hypothetical protein HBNXNv_0345 [Candidatus Nanohalobia archaeon BNXNv]